MAEKKTLADFPQLVDEWDWEKNVGNPFDYSAFSNVRVFWKCKKGHSFGPKAIYERTRQDGKATNCPYCANKKVLPGFNDLETWCKSTGHADLLDQWDYSVNEKLPNEYMPHTDKKVFWKCAKGHSYQMRICEKTKENPYGCPVCSNKQLLVGYNDLKTLYPELAEEWDYSNNPTKPEDHIPGDHTKVQWVCKQCGYRWEASIKERARHGTNCPQCAFYYKTSSPEQAVYYYLKKSFPDAINSYKPGFLGGMEIDVFIPSISIAVEYDGKNWHENSQRDKHKSTLLRDRGIKLIRIKEKNSENSYDDYCVIRSMYKNKLTELQSALIELAKVLNENSRDHIVMDMDLVRDASEIYALSERSKYNKSLLASNDPVLSEWSYELNGSFTPDKITPGSHKPAWWKCSKCGKTWQQPIKQKVKAGLGCEHCNKTVANNKRVEEAIKSGKKKTILDYPLLLKEWNDPRDPSTVTAGNDKPAKWRCSVCGYEFSQIVKNRTGQGQGCPKCGRKSQAKTRGKPVINIDTGEEYYSIAEAGRKTGIAEVSIRHCCNGDYTQAGGYHWRYK